MKAAIDAFLSPTLESQEPAKPTLTQHYALTFNSVDRFNKLVGYITYLPRVNEQYLLFVGLVQMAIVNTWALIGDVQYDSREVEQQGFDLREFAIELGQDLLN